jgi:hypothetical protein
VVALTAFGVLMLATIIEWGWVAAGIVAVAMIPATASALRAPQLVIRGTLVLPAVVVPLLGLLALDVIWAAVGLEQPAPDWGLVIAGGFVAGIAYTYLRWVGAPPPENVLPWSVLAAGSALLLDGLIRGGVPQLELWFVAGATGVAVAVYLVNESAGDIKRPLWWAVLTVVTLVVFAPLLYDAIHGHRIKGVLLVGGAIAAGFVGLNAIGLSRRRSVGPARALGLAGTILVIALVPLGVWGFVTVTDRPHEEPNPVPVTAAAPARPVSQYALDRRPVLKFDSGERLHTPLNIDAWLRTETVELCPEGTGLLADCSTLSSAADLRNGVGNLRFSTQDIGSDIPTTIYVHEVDDRVSPGTVDLDYWWYLPDNPADTAQGAMCGAGLVIPEITCFDHQSDWEGVTVVVDEATHEPVEVHYAAHDHVVSVPWSLVRTDGDRPLVYVARGTHAAYPAPCPKRFCSASLFEDNSHDGHYTRPGTACAGRCVAEFPRSAKGGRPASWNAFDGEWGSAVCVANVYCKRAHAPRAPAQQSGGRGRFARPWCYDRVVRGHLGTPKNAPALPGCEKPK